MPAEVEPQRAVNRETRLLVTLGRHLEFTLLGASHFVQPLAAEVRAQGLLLKRQINSYRRGRRAGRIRSLCVTVGDTVVNESAVAYSRGDPTSAWLPITVDGPDLYVGPLSHGGHRGCVLCLRLRCQRTELRPFPVSAGMRDRCSPTFLLWVPLVSRVLLAEALTPRYLARSGPFANVLVIDSILGSVSLHALLPAPECTLCVQEPLGDELNLSAYDTHRLGLNETAAVDPLTLREASSPDLEELVSRVHSSRSGIVLRIEERLDLPIPTATASTCRGGTFDLGVGRALRLRDARQIAVLEALERYASLNAALTRVFEATPADLGEAALDLNSVVLHSPEQYAADGFPFAVPDSDRRRPWIWGYSFRSEGPIAVPLELAFYGERKRFVASGVKPVAYEVSNGCALGSSLAEALLFALLEIIERDAFLVTWYAKRRVPEVSLEELRDEQALALSGSLERMGYQLRVLDISTEFHVPAVWALALSTRRNQLASLSSAGAHFNVRRAVWSALVELATALPLHKRRYETSRVRAQELILNSDLVEYMDDHALLYGTEDSVHRLDFLCDASVGREKPKHSGNEDDSRSLSDLMRQLIDNILSEGFDVVCVNTTPPELGFSGLATVRAIIPGTLPMTFGHKYRRLYPNGRVTKYASDGRLFEWPHPFP